MRLLHFRRTFVEKLFAIHSKVEILKRDGRPLGTCARHYYDLVQLAVQPEVTAMLNSAAEGPSPVTRQKAIMLPSCPSNNFLAGAWWACSATASAIQTFTSGKQIIKVEAGKIQRAARAQSDQRQFYTARGRGRGWPADLFTHGLDDQIFQAGPAHSGGRLGTTEQGVGDFNCGAHISIKACWGHPP